MDNNNNMNTDSKLYYYLPEIGSFGMSLANLLVYLEENKLAEKVIKNCQNTTLINHSDGRISPGLVTRAITEVTEGRYTGIFRSNIINKFEETLRKDYKNSPDAEKLIQVFQKEKENYTDNPTPYTYPHLLFLLREEGKDTGKYHQEYAVATQNKRYIPDYIHNGLLVGQSHLQKAGYYWPSGIVELIDTTRLKEIEMMKDIGIIGTGLCVAYKKGHSMMSVNITFRDIPDRPDLEYELI